MKKIIVVFFLALAFGCGAKVSDAPAPGPVVSNELADCATSTSYGSPVLVSGTATFFKRGLNVTTSAGEVTGKMTLGAPITSALPIKFAEVRVLNAAGAIVQCGKTNAAGALKALDGTSNLNIPNAAGNYTVQVLSRANHAMAVTGGKPAFQFYASVKADIYSNAVYALSQSVTSSGSGSVSATLIAYARESQSPDVIGGAFNIFNDIITTYEYLNSNTALSNLSCLSPKLNVFWKVGFNPAQYIYPTADPATVGTLSFYARGENGLYINGGKLGNITSEDTDHFDDAVIIHEIGHHIEYSCGGMDSPGGTHFGLYRTDARLAWSEGFGNFFGAHIIRNNINAINPNLAAQVVSADGWLQYLDTTGYVDGAITTGDEYIRIKMTKLGNNPESIMTANGVRNYDKVNAVTNPGEGHFRETSVARALFKNTNTCTNCVGTSYFSQMWRAFEKATATGMGNAAYPSRSSARFYSRLHAVFGNATPAAIDTVLDTDEAQQRETAAAFTVGGFRVHVPYGIKLVPSASVCILKIQPRADTGLDTNFQSDQRYSNHFYSVDLTALTGVTEIRLTSTFVAGTAVDIDSILYKDTYSYDEDCAAYAANGTCSTAQKSVSSDMVRYDRTAGNGTKTLANLSSLSAASKYLLNVRAYTPKIAVLGNTEYTYELKDQLGGSLCPASPY